MMNKQNSFAFTGHRTEKLPQSEENMFTLQDYLKKEVTSAIENGYTTFYTGMAYGFDLMAGALILEMKEKFDLKLIAAVPFRGQEKAYNQENIKEYQRILSHCNDVIVCHEKFRRGIYHQRNRLMVDNSNLVIAYSNGTGGTHYTVNYAQKKGVTVINLYIT